MPPPMHMDSTPYLTPDDFDLRVQSEREAVIAGALYLVLDGVQRARDLLIAVKRAVCWPPLVEGGMIVMGTVSS